MALFGPEEDAAVTQLLEEIRGCTPEAMTPLEALALLHRLKERIAGRE